MTASDRGRLLRRVRAGSLLVTAIAVGTAWAHPLAPALLDLRELGGGRVAVTWKSSLFGVPGAQVAPVLPPHCRNEGVPNSTTDGDSVTATWTMACDAAGLVGERVGCRGLDEARIEALVRVTLADGRVIRGVVRGDEPLLTIPTREDRFDIARAYLRFGVEHILAGYDHLLFVVGLLLLVRNRRSLIETIIAFTVGHSLTLSLAVLDVVHVAPHPIDLLVALSVFALAAELARDPEAPPSLLRRRPWLVALIFGLLHGFGFAAALREHGLPEADVALALIAFNVGIEIGLLAFVILVLTAAAAVRRMHVAWPRWALRVPLYTMGSLAAFWCFERAAALIH
jgi:hypothetical protein